MTHSAWWLVVNALAVYRLSILLSKDKITDPVRKWVWRRGYTREPLENMAPRMINVRLTGRRGKIGRAAYELVICPWCLSIWFSGVAVCVTQLAPTAWQWIAVILAFSGVTVVATRREE